MADSRYCEKRERLATLLFERLEDVTTYSQARRVATKMLERIEARR